MYAIVTGASSGIGFEICRYLSNLGYDIVAVGRNKKELENLKSSVDSKVIIEICDLQKLENAKKFYEKYKDEKVDILVNCAGIGQIGDFSNIPFEQDIKLINLNIISLHFLTKSFLKSMIKKDRGYIMNVSSSAAFAPGPLMATYYATKSYVFKLTQAINKELKKKKINVCVSVLCPGPVDTNFNSNMNARFSVKPVSPKYVAKYSIDKLLKNKTIIVPGIKNKFGIFLSKILPEFILEEYIYNMQARKIK